MTMQELPIADWLERGIVSKEAAEEYCSTILRIKHELLLAKYPPLFCSFCRVSQHNVEMIISGPNKETNICSACVDLCNEILNEKETEAQS